jgi:hypothetical protein
LSAVSAEVVAAAFGGVWAVIEVEVEVEVETEVGVVFEEAAAGVEHLRVVDHVKSHAPAIASLLLEVLGVEVFQ